MATIGYTKITNIKGDPGPRGDSIEGPRGQDGKDGKDGIDGVDGRDAIGVELIDEALAGYVNVADSKFRIAINSAVDSCIKAKAPKTVELWRYLQGSETIDQFASRGPSVHTLMQRAIDDMGQKYLIDGIARAVRVPAGQYTLTTRLYPPDRGGAGVIGAGSKETIFFSGETNQFMAPFGDPNEGGWTPENNPYYHDLWFQGFKFDATNHRVSDGWGGGNRKFFSLGHVKDSHFRDLVAVNTHSTAFGLDYNENNSFFECYAINCGRGRLSSVDSQRVGSGAGFGLGAGTNTYERTVLISCGAFNCGSNGFFFEHLHRVEADHESIGFMMIGCWSQGNFIGITDGGGTGSILLGCTIVGNTRAGIRVSGTQTDYEGGTLGRIANCTISHNGVGIAVGTAGYGAYEVIGNSIFENITHGLLVEDIANDINENSRVGRGWLITANQFHRNGGCGIKTVTKFLIPDMKIDNNDFFDNGEEGIEFNSPTWKAAVTNNRFRGNVDRAVAFRGTDRASFKPRIRDNDWDGNIGGGCLIEHTVADRSQIRGNIGTAETVVWNEILNPVPSSKTAWVGDTGWTQRGDVNNLNWISSGGYKDAGYLEITTTASFADPQVASPFARVRPGDVLTGSILAQAPRGASMRVTVWEGSTIIYGTMIHATGKPQWLHYIGHIVSAGVSTLRVGVEGRELGGVGNESGPPGSKMQVFAAQLTKGGDLFPFLWGGDTAFWEAEASASRSGRIVPVGSIATRTVRNMITRPVPKDTIDLWTSTGSAANRYWMPGGMDGLGMMEVTTTAGFPAANIASPPVAVVAGEVWYGYIAVRVPAKGNVQVNVWEGSTIVYSAAKPVQPAYGGIQILRIEHTVSAGATALRVGVTGTGIATGGVMQVSRAMLTKDAVDAPFVWGNAPQMVWEGTQYASTSLWTVPA